MDLWGELQTWRKVSELLGKRWTPEQTKPIEGVIMAKGNNSQKKETKKPKKEKPKVLATRKTN